MKRSLKKIAVVPIICLLSACQAFLGPEPDDSPKGIFETIWNDFDRNYALFEHKNINWNTVYDYFAPQVRQNMSENELFELCFNMLSVLNDAHVMLNTRNYGRTTSEGPYSMVNGQIVQVTKPERDPYPFHDEIVSNYIDIFDSNYGFSYGKFKTVNAVGYIRISTFDGVEGVFMQAGDWTKEIDNILQRLEDNTDAIVLDVRNNGGGFPSNLDHIASRFVSTQKDYMEVQTKNGPGKDDFSPLMKRTIRPSAAKRYTKPIFLLTDNRTGSCAEWFTLALKTQDHVTHVGSATWGIMSMRIIRPLINGWDYSVSVQRTLDMNGVNHEGTGISPDIEVAANIDYFERIDSALEKVLELLK